MIGQSTTAPTAPPLRIILTGGGTGGHVSPILAVLDELDRRGEWYRALWIGSKRGIERETADRRQIPFRPVAVGKLRRYISLRTLPDAARVPLGVAQCLPIILRSRPHVIFSTGGYVGVPAVVAGRTLGIPSLTHEQTAVLGLATRINTRFSECVALSSDRTPRPRMRKGGRVVVTGNPIRGWLREGNANEAVSIFQLQRELPLLYVTGGAQGALAINEAVGASLESLLEIVEIVHQTGPRWYNRSYQELTALRAALPSKLAARYHLTETVGEELGHLYAATDLVLGRSGAGTVAELAALGKPSILVPLPGAAEQRENARTLESVNAAIVIDQDDLTPCKLVDTVRNLASDEEGLARMASAARSIEGDDSPAERLVDEILTLAKPRRLPR